MNASGKKKSQKSSPVHMNHCIFLNTPNEEEKKLKHPSFVF